ncbi:hypothetical protein RFI_20539, partial [Reticulomyxa filosa]
VQYAGYDKLNWSDQHCHLEFDSWHFGSDMAKVILDSGSHDIHFAWVVCADTLRKKVDVSWLFVVKDDSTLQEIEKLSRKLDPLQSKLCCLQFVNQFVTMFTKQLNHEKYITQLHTLLFGAKQDGVEHATISSPPLSSFSEPFSDRGPVDSAMLQHPISDGHEHQSHDSDEKNAKREDVSSLQQNLLHASHTIAIKDDTSLQIVSDRSPGDHPSHSSMSHPLSTPPSDHFTQDLSEISALNNTTDTTNH